MLLILLWLAGGPVRAAPLLVGPELVTDGSFERLFLPDWSEFGWGRDGPPHSGAIGMFTIFDTPDVAFLSQVIEGLLPGETYLISLWVSNSFQSRVPMSNGISVEFGTDRFTAFDVGEDYAELTFLSVAGAPSQVLTLSGFNDPRAFFLDDVSVRQVAAGAPELNGEAMGPAFWALSLLFLACRSREWSTAGSRRPIRKGSVCSDSSSSAG